MKEYWHAGLGCPGLLLSVLYYNDIRNEHLIRPRGDQTIRTRDLRIQEFYTSPVKKKKVCIHASCFIVQKVQHSHRLLCGRLRI